MSIVSFLDMKVLLAKKLNPRFYRIKATIKAMNNFKEWKQQ